MDLVDAALARLAGAELAGVRFARADRAVIDVVLAGVKAVVKVDTSPGRYRSELLGLEAAARAGVLVPEVLTADPGPPSIVALARVAGAALDGTHPPELWRTVGALVARLHREPVHDDVPRFGGRGLPWGEHLEQWTDREGEAIVAAGLLDSVTAAAAVARIRAGCAAGPSPEVRLLHGDLQSDHVLVAGDPPAVRGIVDFGDTGAGDPLWDLSVLTLRDAERLADVADGYGLSPEERARADLVVPAYRLLRDLGSATWLLEHGYDPAPAVAAVRSAPG